MMRSASSYVATIHILLPGGLNTGAFCRSPANMGNGLPIISGLSKKVNGACGALTVPPSFGEDQYFVSDKIY